MTLTVDDGIRIWVDDVLLLDEFTNAVVDGNSPSVFIVPTASSLIAGQLVSIKIEYREDAGSATLVLGWSSPSQPYEIIPVYRMFPNVVEITGSPFNVIPTGRKPTLVQNVSLSIASWNQLYCNFTTPVDDGGSEIVSYHVEWYDASTTSGPFEIQAISISENVIGGTFRLMSPGSIPYPYDIPYDVSASDLNFILEIL